MSFSLGAISESTSEMEKASRMSEINFGVSLVFLGKARNKLIYAIKRDTFQSQYSIDTFNEIAYFAIMRIYFVI